MSTVIDIDHEAGDLSEYDSTVTDGGDLSADASAAMASTSYGLKALIDDTTAIYGQVGLSSLARFRVRFYLDPSNLSMDDDTEHEIVDTDTGPFRPISLYLHYESGSFELAIGSGNDADSMTWGSYFDISAGEQYVEMGWMQSTGPGNDDGYLKVWVDGVLKDTISSLDNDTVEVDVFKIGATRNIEATTSGSCYFDQILANDDGGLIGPHTAAQTITMDLLSLVGAGQSLTVSPAAVAMAMDLLTLTGAGQGLTVSPGAVAMA